jgi:glycerol-3-phosphate dehydrogenase (NAD(P)+)
MPELRVAVLGGGSWGTTVAHLTAHNRPTTLWARNVDTVAEVNADHRNSRYLAGWPLHPGLRATDDLGAAVSAADLVVMGVPTSSFRETAKSVAEHIRPWVPVVSLAKGFEEATRLRMTQIIEEELPGHPTGVLTGPNLAKEILAGQPAAAVLALSELHIAAQIQPVFTTPWFRVFLHHDTIGCELGGGLKNVYALAAGSADGMGMGDNTRSALITRGLAEMTELGVAMGGRPLTFAGLAGMGDLLATCVSPQSRNSRVGRELGAGRRLEDILAELGQVAEGVKASKVVMGLAADHGVAMPIAAQVYAVCHEGRTVQWAVDWLMRGRIGHEAGMLFDHE